MNLIRMKPYAIFLYDHSIFKIHLKQFCNKNERT